MSKKRNHNLAPAMNRTDTHRFVQLVEIYLFLKAASKLRSKVLKFYILFNGLLLA